MEICSEMHEEIVFDNVVRKGCPLCEALDDIRNLEDDVAHLEHELANAESRE